MGMLASPFDKISLLGLAIRIYRVLLPVLAVMFLTMVNEMAIFFTSFTLRAFYLVYSLEEQIYSLHQVGLPVILAH